MGQVKEDPALHLCASYSAPRASRTPQTYLRCRYYPLGRDMAAMMKRSTERIYLMRWMLVVVRAPFDKQITNTQDDFDPWYPPGCYSSIPSRDCHIAFLFTRLHGAITDPTMDFDGILAETRGLPSTPPASSRSGEAGRDSYRDPRNEISHQSITAPVNSGSTHMAINIDNNHGFRANAAPCRPTHSEASSSSSRGPLSWATVLRTARPGPSPGRVISVLSER